jgi:hypothetical protein
MALTLGRSILSRLAQAGLTAFNFDPQQPDNIFFLKDDAPRRPNPVMPGAVSDFIGLVSVLKVQTDTDDVLIKCYVTI